MSDFPERLTPTSDPNDSESQRHIKRYLFASNYVKNKRVLDIACGVGYGTEILLKSGAKFVIGMDNSLKAIRYAKKNFMGLFMVGNAEKLDLKPQSYDIVVSFETIEHLKDFNAFLNGVRIGLKVGGLLILSAPNVMGFYEKHRQKGNRFHKWFFSGFEWLQIVKGHGFEIMSIWGQEQPYFIFPGRSIYNKLIGYERNTDIRSWTGNQRTIIIVARKKSGH